VLKIVGVPAFNEERTVSDIVKRSLVHVDKVIVCDDGSSDDTVSKAKEAGAIVISHKKNLGKGAAMKSLFKEAKKLNADVMVTIDGDGQFLPEEIPKLIEPIIEGDYDIVLGYRFDNRNEMPTYRKFGNVVLDKITSAASALPFRDTQGGFRAYSKKAVEQIKFLTDGFGADSEILVDASRKDLKITEKKVTVIYDTGGKTSTKHPVKHSGDVVVSLLELIAIESPLKFLGIPGIILFIVGIVYSVVVIAIFNDTRYFSIPSTLVAMGTLIIGLMLILMATVLFAIQRSLRRKI